jgi:GDP-L-fucose synthase
MELNAKYMSGHNGMVSSIYLVVNKLGYTITRTRKELDLLNLSKIIDFFILERPEYVFLCAAKVGGIKANVDFLRISYTKTLLYKNNIIKCSKDFRVKSYYS